MADKKPPPVRVQTPVWVLLWSNGSITLQKEKPTQGMLDSSFDGEYVVGSTYAGNLWITEGQHD
jgi:hypothetical protein